MLTFDPTSFLPLRAPVSRAFPPVAALAVAIDAAQRHAHTRTIDAHAPDHSSGLDRYIDSRLFAESFHIA